MSGLAGFPGMSGFAEGLRQMHAMVQQSTTKLGTVHTRAEAIEYKLASLEIQIGKNLTN
jgi:hypothetical protein